MVLNIVCLCICIYVFVFMHFIRQEPCMHCVHSTDPLYGCQYCLLEKTSHKRFKQSFHCFVLEPCKVAGWFSAIKRNPSLPNFKRPLNPKAPLLTFFSLVKIRIALVPSSHPCIDLSSVVVLDFALNCRCQPPSSQEPTTPLPSAGTSACHL